MRHMRTGALATVMFLAAASALAEEPGAADQCRMLLSAGKHAEAKASCEAAGESREGKLLHGDYLASTRDLEGAIKRYSEGLEGYDAAKPTELQLALLQRRAIVHFHLGHSRSASEDASAVLKHRPDDPEMIQVIAATTPSDEVRLKYVDKLIALQPDNADFIAWRARALHQAGRHQEAIDAAEKALKIDPKSDHALTIRGFAYSAMGDHAKAVRDHTTVAKRNPTDAQPRANVAEAHLAAKRFPEAITAATEALAIDAANVDALMVRAQARLSMGDGESALADMDSVLKLNPALRVAQLQNYANALVEAQRAFSAASVKQFEADREYLLQYVWSHLRSSCGYFRQPDYEDNANLNAYWDCVKAWQQGDDARFEMNPGEEVLAADKRFSAMVDWIGRAEPWRCSNMPKKSRCIDDKLYARVEAAAAGMDEPKLLVRKAELTRLNAEVAAYNASVKRQNALATTANFLQALADELARQ